MPRDVFDAACGLVCIAMCAVGGWLALAGCDEAVRGGARAFVVVQPGPAAPRVARHRVDHQRVVGRQAAQIGEAEQRGHVGIVHEQVVAITVGLVSQHLAAIGQLHDAVRKHRRFNLGGERARFGGKGLVLQHRPRHFGQFAIGSRGLGSMSSWYVAPIAFLCSTAMCRKRARWSSSRRTFVLRMDW